MLPPPYVGLLENRLISMILTYFKGVAMELKNSIKEVVSGIYHMVLDGSDNCPSHGKSITDYINENSLQQNHLTSQ